MIRSLAIVLALTACTLTHGQARQMRYASVVPLTGGVLVAISPKLNGDPFGTGTGAAGVALVSLGLGLLIGSYAWETPQP